MERDLLKKMLLWKDESERKPLILQGARQTGKTYLLKEFASTFFDRMHYFDLERLRGDFVSIFEGGVLDSLEIVRKLEFISGRAINFDTDILIFDEIQAIPRAITSLKYFQEEIPELAVMCAGSNLGVSMTDAPFPVGKVKCMTLYPMTFMEFLRGMGENRAYEYIEGFDCSTCIDDLYHKKVLELLKVYFVTGGLPEVVDVYHKYRESSLVAFSKVRELQNQLIMHYERDFSKYSGEINSRHIERVFSAVPKQLSSVTDSTSSKFKFKNVISSGFRSYEALADPIDWLKKAGLVLKVPIVDHVATPLLSAAVESRFKLMLFDVGILGAMINLPPREIINHDYGSYKGYFVENFVLTELEAYGFQVITNWHGRTSEVEFVVETEKRGIIPIEVKAGINSKSKSLSAFINKYHPESAFKFTGKKYGKKDVVETFPLYMVSIFAGKVR